MELNVANALLLFRLSEPHGPRSAAVPNGFGAVHLLWDLEVPQRQIVEAGRKSPGRHVSQGADIEFAHAITIDGLSACGEQMPRANDGNIDPEFLSHLLGQGGDGGVMSADAVNRLSFLVLNTLTSLRNADIPVAKVGHGADNQFRSVLIIAEHKHFVFRGCSATTDHVDIKGLEQLLGSIEEGRGIVVARDDDDMPTG